MFADYPARLRDLVSLCRRAAERSYELDAKASLRTISEGLSTMADEIERSRRPQGGAGLRGEGPASEANGR
jgi:hypothetical protein